MKFLLLIRHAKSGWNFDVDDFHRPLNERGMTDAPLMAKRLLKKEIKIDAFISSPAKRAFTTAAFFAEAYGKKSKEIVTIPSLYEPTCVAFYNAVETLDVNLFVFIASSNFTMQMYVCTSIPINDLNQLI